MNKEEYKIQIQNIRDRQTELDADRAKLQSEYMNVNEAQPGDKALLTWKNGDRATVAVIGLEVRPDNDNIVEWFAEVRANGEVSRTRFVPQPGYTLEIMEKAAFPEYVVGQSGETDISDYYDGSTETPNPNNPDENYNTPAPPIKGIDLD